ncbi:MAG: N-acetylmuramoyl-L-alanine amidase [Pseudomonadota bacterium]
MNIGILINSLKQAKYRFLIVLSLLFFSMAAYSAGSITAARVWPAQEYTRIALESEAPIKYQLIVLKNPDRLVLDIENIDLNSTLKTLSDKILSSDPYIQQVRVANFKTNIVRVVIDLKGEVKPNIFALTPAGEYRYRLVLDIYPLQDELMAMLGKKSVESTAESSTQTSAEISDSTASTQPRPVIEPLPADAGEAAESPSEPPNVSAQSANPPLSEETATDKNNKPNERLITIAIDAGHGGEDPGARGANGSHEKVITLAIAKKLKAKIDAEPNMRGVLTRDGDYFVPLGMRVLKARKLKSDLFVSIHADAFTNPAAHGSSVFALSEKGATSASARYLAKKENESDLIGGVSLHGRDPVLARTLLDLSQAAMINDSLKLGKAVLAQIGDINKLHKNHVEQAGFAVLKSPDIPSILVETAFISNPEEERRLNSDAYQDKLVNSILTGIKQYFSTQPAFARN